ncbi:NifU N-terminal domain-containing protein [Fictibacillus sp. 5RED26]|jgi:predicted kinase|uniref:NifU N-terminal domain-containing protein n=1 Tax=Fictibacillus TaxID=1329200 RepID=UPI0018CD87DE|nr:MULTISPECIES: NifU N-terminal domain-containing protein [unclassified Fictibacillus]MBH0155607.1 NifU N-terminal domain-containing protein [Fictibacillus sp. 5RED26]MBH0172800.1 NifU N-terminal domain-containing protein [Fictibacillus sp. 23RED33]
MAVEFSIQPTPNPNAIKFDGSEKFLEGRLSARVGDESDSTLAKALLSIDGVESIFGFENFITVNKTNDSDWNELMPEIQKALEENA